MPRLPANGIEIEYLEEGDPGGRPMVLVNGLGGQLTGWSPELVAGLVERGFRVVRFDNRDVGLSTWLDEEEVPAVVGGWAMRDRSEPSYGLEEMADDAAGVIEARGLGSAHVLGVSLGGMIVQMLTIRHPERVRSLCSVMSTTGRRDVGVPTPEAMAVLLRKPAAGREAIVEQGLEGLRVIGSPGYPFDEARERARYAAAYDRAYHPAGVARQLAAVLVAVDRTEALGSVSVPTLVVHGADDPLIPLSGGEATAAAVPGARLLVLPGMGHELPPALVPQVVEAVVENADRADDGGVA